MRRESGQKDEALRNSVGEDLPIIDRIYRHSAILGVMVADFESNVKGIVARPGNLKLDDDRERLKQRLKNDLMKRLPSLSLESEEREQWARFVDGKGADIVGTDVADWSDQDIEAIEDSLSRREGAAGLPDVDKGRHRDDWYRILGEAHRLFLEECVQNNSGHPWCKQRHWFFGLPGERDARPMKEAEEGRAQDTAPMKLATEVPVNSTQITEIRKIWETGTEKAVLQSVIQMDGDVITRVHPTKVHEQELHALHTQATKTAIKTWMDMFKLITELVSDTFNKLFGLLGLPSA